MPLFLQPFPSIRWPSSFLATMDASSVAAAALAVATEHSRDAALRQALLDRERAAMTAEDRGSFLAQRLYTGSTQVPSEMRPMTWRAAHRHVQNDVIGMRGVVVLALRAIREGNSERAEALLADELGSDEMEELRDVEEEEEETEEEDAPTAWTPRGSE